MAVALGHMKGPDGLKDNPSGVTQKYYVAVKGDILTLPDIQRDPNQASTNIEVNTIVDDILFDVDKGFIEVYSTKDTGKLTYESVGGKDGKMLMGKFEAFYPGDDNEASAKVKILKNNQLVILVEEMDGTIKLLGSVKQYADLDSFSKTTGNISGEEVRGFKLEFQQYEVWEMFYEGIITLLA